MSQDCHITLGFRMAMPDFDVTVGRSRGESYVIEVFDDAGHLEKQKS